MPQVALTPPGVAESFMVNLLTGDSALMSLITKVYTHSGPKGAVYLFAELENTTGNDAQALGMIITLTAMRYTLTVWDNTGTIQRIDPAMARAHALLQGASGVQSGGVVEGITRRRIIAMGSPSDGIEYRRLIATYDVYVKIN